jgi:hypothetical protein
MGFMIVSCASTKPQQGLPITNGTVMNGLAGEIARTLIQEAEIIRTDTCEVLFVPAEGLAFLEHAFVESIRESAGFVKTVGSSAGRTVAVELQPLLVRVVYSDPFRNGVFGQRMTERSIVVEVSAKIVRHPGAHVTVSGVRRKQFQDTVRVDDVRSLESSVLAVTRADVPDETFLDRILGPLIVLSSSGVLLYLLYTIRS